MQTVVPRLVINVSGNMDLYTDNRNQHQHICNSAHTLVLGDPVPAAEKRIYGHDYIHRRCGKTAISRHSCGIIRRFSDAPFR